MNQPHKNLNLLRNLGLPNMFQVFIIFTSSHMIIIRLNREDLRFIPTPNRNIKFIRQHTTVFCLTAKEYHCSTKKPGKIPTKLNDPASLLHIQPFVPVPNWLLSRFCNRDKASGTKASRLLFQVAEPGQKVPDVKKNFCTPRDSISRPLA